MKKTNKLKRALALALAVITGAAALAFVPALPASAEDDELWIIEKVEDDFLRLTIKAGYIVELESKKYELINLFASIQGTFIDGTKTIPLQLNFIWGLVTNTLDLKDYGLIYGNVYKIAFTGRMTALDGQTIMPILIHSFTYWIDVPIRPSQHHEFAGWYYDQAFTIPYIDGSFDINTLFPKWVLKIYTVSFTTGIDNIIITKNVEALSPVSPVDLEGDMPGSVFLGWYTTSSFDVLWDFYAPVIGNMTLYARWAGQMVMINLIVGDELYGVFKFPFWTSFNVVKAYIRDVVGITYNLYSDSARTTPIEITNLTEDITIYAGESENGPSDEDIVHVVLPWLLQHWWVFIVAGALAVLILVGLITILTGGGRRRRY